MKESMKRRAVEWQGKQNRLKRFVVGSVMVVLAVIVTVVWNALTGNRTDWVSASVIGFGGVGAFLVSMSAYTNTTLVAMYYAACERLVAAPEELELVTGTIQEVHRLKVPYIGQLYQVTVVVAGQALRYYMPGTLLRTVNPQERIRLWTHDLFAIKVESTGVVDRVIDSDAENSPTKSA